MGILIGFAAGMCVNGFQNGTDNVMSQTKKVQYWFVLHRKSEIEYLYKGVAGVVENSTLVKQFQVNTGVPGKKPTPLPRLLGRDYFLITKKFETKDIPETAPYFLEFDIPVPSDPPYGPAPYLECTLSPGEAGNGQCDWEIPGPFGLHGINGDEARLVDEGSSGCIRHRDDDITYLYNLLEPTNEEIRYYIEDI